MIASTPRFSQNAQWHHAMSNKLLSTFSEDLTKDINGTIKRFIALQFIGIKGSKLLQRELRTSTLQSLPNQKALKVGLKILQQQDFLNLKMSKQQLWLFGGKDRLIPIKMKNDLSILYPNAVIAEIAEAGHAPFMTHPKEFMHIMNHFFSTKYPITR
jgi:pimeloyl-[acyl-carrier protein] methyl ester esterase